MTPYPAPQHNLHACSPQVIFALSILYLTYALKLQHDRLNELFTYVFSSLCAFAALVGLVGTCFNSRPMLLFFYINQLWGLSNVGTFFVMDVESNEQRCLPPLAPSCASHCRTRFAPRISLSASLLLQPPHFAAPRHRFGHSSTSVHLHIIPPLPSSTPLTASRPPATPHADCTTRAT